MRAKCLAQEHKTMTPAGSEPGLNSRQVIQSTGPPRLRFLLQANVCRLACVAAGPRTRLNPLYSPSAN